MDNKLITHIIYSGLGGHANVLFPLLENSFSDHFENHVVFFGIEEVNPDYIQKCNVLGVKFTRIQKKRKRYLGAFSQLKKLLKQQNPHCVIVHNSEMIISASQFARKHATHTIYVEHENNQSKSRFLHFLSKYARKKSDAIVCLNHVFKQEYESLYGATPNLHVIENGIDIEKFTPVQKPQNLICGLAGRMVEVKDHHNLIKAFKKVVESYPKAQLLLAGDGPLKKELEALSAQLELSENIQFLGLLNEDEMISFYKSLSLYTHATHAETMSTAILQAMSCELPIITADIKNNKILVEDQVNGWLYATNNAEDLASKIISAHQNREEFERFGKANRLKVLKQFSAEQMSLKYTALIESLS